MTDNVKGRIVRILTGGALGISGLLLYGYVLGSLSLFGSASFAGFVFYLGSLPDWAGNLLSFSLWFLFGAEIAAATLPFAEEGRELLLCSLFHFTTMTLTVGIWVCLNFGWRELPRFLVPMALIYVLVWLGRWAGWYAELGEIRARLGLSSAPSLFKWRETLPHVVFALLLCAMLPAVLWQYDAHDVPLLRTGYTWMFLPTGGFIPGASLGRRQGVCPLYPLACAGFMLLFVLLARLFSRVADGSLVWVALVSSLSGNLLGAGVRWIRGRDRT